MRIDPDAAENLILLNPRMPSARADGLLELANSPLVPKSSVLVLTSGSTGTSDAGVKWVVLSKQAIMNSATAANAFLGAIAADVWLHPLPDFHVGGLGIWARAQLNGSRVIRMDPDGGWQPTAFVNTAEEFGCSLTSLVPTQVHDLVRAGLIAPPSLRAIVVGGGALSEALYYSARELGWPILPSYGLTETASAVATAPLSSLNGSSFPELSLLPHSEARECREGLLELRTNSLLTGYLKRRDQSSEGGNLWDPKNAEGWFQTEDFGTVSRDVLALTGRVTDRLKIGGELTNLAHLRNVFSATIPDDNERQFALHWLPDERLGAAITLFCTPEVDARSIAVASTAFNAAVLPFERIRQTRRVAAIPTTELGKVKWGELAAIESAPLV